MSSSDYDDVEGGPLCGEEAHGENADKITACFECDGPLYPEGSSVREILWAELKELTESGATEERWEGGMNSTIERILSALECSVKKK